MTHLYYGDPTNDFSLQLAKTLVNSGADILEIGIPYSDPVSDGEVFQKASNRALTNGTTPFDVFDGIKKLRKLGIKVPIYITSYFGPVYKMGIEKFIQKVVKVNAQGVIIPDILLEEQNELLFLSKKYNISIIQFATSYSSDERLKQIISVSSGFIYCISGPNVTGSKNTLNKDTILLIKRINKLEKEMDRNIPIFVGFGISTPEQVKLILNSGGDGVIVGSAIAKIYQDYLDVSLKSLSKVVGFIKILKKATYVKIKKI